MEELTSRVPSPICPSSRLSLDLSRRTQHNFNRASKNSQVGPEALLVGVHNIEAQYLIPVEKFAFKNPSQPCELGPWKTVEEPELENLSWVQWHNQECHHGFIGESRPQSSKQYRILKSLTDKPWRKVQLSGLRQTRTRHPPPPAKITLVENQQRYPYYCREGRLHRRRPITEWVLKIAQRKGLLSVDGSQAQTSEHKFRESN